MRNKLLTLVGMFMVGLGALAATTQGCGGSSGPSAADINAVCTQGCKTEVMCIAGLTMDSCVSRCTSGVKTGSGASCSNSDAIVSAAKTCAAMTDCTALETCFLGLPKCMTGSGGSTGSAGQTAGGAGSTGSAGSTVTGGAGSTGSAGITGGGGVFGGGGIFGGAGIFGTGGNFGIAGVGGTTCDTACTKADACCKALPGANAANCTFKANCDAATDMTTAVKDCNGVLETASLLGANEPAACK
jgi:hypothetical protein